MFCQILVLLDGSKRAEQAFIIARRLSHTTQTTLTLLSVVDPESAESTHRASYLTHLTRYVQSPLLTYDCLVREGALIPTIMSVIEERQIDLIILCSHDPQEAAQRPQSVTRQLIEQCTIPVLALKEGCIIPNSAFPDRRRPLHSVEIVVALDGTEQAEQAILPAAHLVSAIALPARGTVHLVHIHRIPAAQVHWTQQQLRATEEYQQALGYVRKQARQLQEIEGNHLNIAVLYSVFPATETPTGLIQFAEKRNGIITGASDILAMYTHQRPQREHAFRPYVTDTVFSDVELPLFVV